MAKSIRLNKAIRETILENIKVAWVKANPAPEYKGKDSVKIIHDCVVKMYDKRTKELRELIGSNTRLMRAIGKANEVYVQTSTGSGTYVYLPNDESGKKRTFIASECIQHNFANQDELDKSADMRKAVVDFNKAKKATGEHTRLINSWETKRTAYMEQCSQVIYGVNTTAQLVEVWAELAPFIPAGYRDPSYINLPAINVKSLNDALKVK